MTGNVNSLRIFKYIPSKSQANVRLEVITSLKAVELANSDLIDRVTA